MKSAPDMLLVGSESLANELSAALQGTHVVNRPDPFDALEEMGHRHWDTVVLSGNLPDLKDLGLASRRLQRGTRLLALCRPIDEPAVRTLVGEAIDDYLLYPLSRADLRKIAPTDPGAAPHAREPGRVPAAHEVSNHAPGEFLRENLPLSTAQLGKMIESARSQSMLEESVAEVVSQLIGQSVRWLDATALSPQDRPLLLTAWPSPRTLATDAAAELLPAARGALHTLQGLLAPLAASAERMESLHRLAITDHLTGSYNRRYFYLMTDRVLRRAHDAGTRAALLLYDIDDFKQYNETFGYAVGDEILRQTVALMRSIFRGHDVVSRIGGDEFAVLFWEPHGPRAADSQPLQTAYDLAERFRQAINSHEFSLLGPQAIGTLSISGGLALFPRDGADVRALLRSADRALKSAKKAGKNGIQIIGQ